MIPTYLVDSDIAMHWQAVYKLLVDHGYKIHQETLVYTPLGIRFELEAISPWGQEQGVCQDQDPTS